MDRHLVPTGIWRGSVARMHRCRARSRDGRPGAHDRGARDPCRPARSACHDPGGLQPVPTGIWRGFVARQRRCRARSRDGGWGKRMSRPGGPATRADRAFGRGFVARLRRCRARSRDGGQKRCVGRQGTASGRAPGEEDELTPRPVRERREPRPLVTLTTNDSSISDRLRKRSVDIDSSTTSSRRNAVIERKVTSRPVHRRHLLPRLHHAHAGMSTTVRVSSGVHCSHARRAGSRVSNTSMPPGRSARPDPSQRRLPSRRR